ncbi:hypothetical protein RU97_GL001243 [Enterococcus canis]|uniref:Acid-resistance membrane protein n=1 Tax=Enterococcus canis TaxID=214095 RepID=A0A1L8RIY6_9ENTE|nr:DUF308 domain-containing protein [Enterococcus canis]OJG19672.1 hypothetical protein RU97_GL001243 [Enterococcus canis]
MMGFFQQYQKNSLFRACLFLLLGILIFINPGDTLRWIFILLAAYFFFMGIISLLGTWRTRDMGTSYAPGVMYLVVGLIILFFGQFFVSLVPFIVGIFVVIEGITSFGQAREFNRLGNSSGALMVYSILLIILGIVLILNPFGTILVLFQIFGLSLMVMGVVLLINYFRWRKLT